MAQTYDLVLRRQSPFFSPWSSGLLETFLELEALDDSLVSLVADVLASWLEHPYVRRYGLFPFRGAIGTRWLDTDKLTGALGLWAAEPPNRGDAAVGLRGRLQRNGVVLGVRDFIYSTLRSGNWTQLMKSNTTPVFTMIELYRRTGEGRWRDAILRWVDAALAHLLNSAGSPMATWYPGAGARNPSLVAGFILMDVLSETAIAIPEVSAQFLATAEQIGRTCLAWAWPSGVIPMGPNAECDHLDGQVDFSIALRRVGELSGNPELRERSFAILITALNLHWTADGFCTHVDYSGRPLFLTANTIDPKYNGLVLKGLIHLVTRERRIYDSADLMDLFKDR